MCLSFAWWPAWSNILLEDSVEVEKIRRSGFPGYRSDYFDGDVYEKLGLARSIRQAEAVPGCAQSSEHRDRVEGQKRETENPSN